MTFGWYRVCFWKDDGTIRCAEEGIIVNDDLAATDPDGYQTLLDYVGAHEPDTSGRNRSAILQLRSRRDFLNNVLWPACQADALIVGFNLPFDLSRLAVSCTTAKHDPHAFSFVLWDYLNKTAGDYRENRYRPRLTIHQLDNKRAFMALTKPLKHPKPHPAFLDLRTLAYALTSQGYSLERACNDFGVSDSKSHPAEHGNVTPEYIDYARQDVKATAGLLVVLRREYDAHPISLPPEKAYSPASIAKSYFEAMGLTPRLQLQPDFPKWALGAAMAAYFGGRAECHIRKTPVPVVYTDVLSMYPTVNCHLKLWDWHTAETLTVTDCTANAQALLDSLALDDVLDKDNWSRFRFVAQIVPDGDILPIRAKYSDGNAPWNIGLNYFTDDAEYCYAGPDLIAAKLLTGKAPRIIRAFTLVPSGTVATRPVNFGGAINIDPNERDFFQAVIEERVNLKHDASDAAMRAVLALKIMANAGCYGIFVEMNQDERENDLAVWNGNHEPAAMSGKCERPGNYANPLIAALITAGARLILAIIERLVTERGGTYAFCDTDSMAIVASKDGGLVPCPGGPLKTSDGREAIKALAWRDVADIAKILELLNPYDRSIVPGSVLKIEDDNFDPNGEQRQLFAYVIAAKRYALFTKDADNFSIVDAKRHGLGYLLDPTELNDDEEGPSFAQERWELALWNTIIRDALGLHADPPPWLGRPAVGRHTISSPWLLESFAAVNVDKEYQDRVKPFNFMLTAFPDPLECLVATKRAELRLIAPFETKPEKWTKHPWYDLRTGKSYRIKVADEERVTSRATVYVRSLRDVDMAYPYHPEAKSNGPDGTVCTQQTTGLLSRRHITAASIAHIGKEAGRLDVRDLLSDVDDAIGHYGGVGLWEKTTRPALIGRDPATLAEAAGLSPQYVRGLLRGIRPGTAESRRRVLVAAADAVRQQTNQSVLRRGPAVSDRALNDAQLVAYAPERTCAGCGQPIGGTARRRYCSAKCRKRAERTRYGA